MILFIKKKLFSRSCFVLTLFSLIACSDKASNRYAPGSFDHADKQLQTALERQANIQQAQGIILFIGDGMSVTTVTASRIFAGQKSGKTGEEHALFLNHSHIQDYLKPIIPTNKRPTLPAP